MSLSYISYDSITPDIYEGERKNRKPKSSNQDQEKKKTSNFLDTGNFLDKEKLPGKVGHEMKNWQIRHWPNFYNYI